MCLSRERTVLKKLFLDFSLDGASVNPYMGCRWSKLHFLSLRLVEYFTANAGESDSCQAINLGQWQLTRRGLWQPRETH